MKKTLFLSAILGAALCSSAFAEITTLTSITAGDITVQGDTFTQITATGDFASLSEGNDATFVKGNGRYQINASTDLSKAGTIVLASAKLDGAQTATSAGQLFVDMWGKSGITITNNLILGETGYKEGDTYSTALRLHESAANNKIVLTGLIQLAQDAKVAINHEYNYIEGNISGASKTLTLTNGGGSPQLHLSGGATLGGLTTNGVLVTFDATKSNGTTTAASTTYTIDSLQGSGALNIADGVTTTIGSATGYTGTISNLGSLTLTGTTNVATTTFDDEQTVEGNDGYSTARFYKQLVSGTGSVTTTGAAFTLTADNKTVDATYADGQISARMETTRYHINAGGTVDYTAGSALADTAATSAIIVNTATTFNIASDAVLQKSRLTAKAATTLTGSGRYEVNGTANMDNNAPASLLNNVTLSGADLTLTIIGGTFKGINLDNEKFGSATLEVKGITGGYIYGWERNDFVLNRNIKLTNNGGDAAWKWTDGSSSDAYTMKFGGTWSGSGNFLKDTENKKEGFAWSGDISGWTGQLRAISGAETALTFSGKAKDIKVSEIRNDKAGVMNITFSADEDMTFANSINKGAEGGNINITVAQNIIFNGAVTADSLAINAGKTATLKQEQLTIASLTMGDGSTLDMTGKKLRVEGASSLSNLKAAQLDFKQFGSKEAAKEGAYTVTLSGESVLTGMLDMSRSEQTGATLRLTEDSSLTHTGGSFWMTKTNAGILLEEGAQYTRDYNYNGPIKFTVKGLSSVAESLGHIEWTADSNGQFNDLNETSVTISNAELTLGANATISTVLNNVALNTNGFSAVLNSDSTVSDLALTSALTVNDGKTLTVTGTANYTGTTATREEAITTGNGFGNVVTYANVISGEGSVAGEATWQIKGNTATLNGQELSYVSDHTDVYYINNDSAITNITADHIGNAGGNVTTNVTLNGNAGTVGMKLNGTQTGSTYTFSGSITGAGNLVIEPTTPAAEKLADTYVFSGDISGWTGADSGSIIATSNTNLTFTGNATEINVNTIASGGHISATYNHGTDVTVSGDVLNDKWTKGGIDLTVTNNTTATFEGTVHANALSVDSGSSAEFAKTSSVASLSGEGAVVVAANADLTVVGNVDIADLSGKGSVNLGGNMTVTGGDVSLGGMTINGGTVTLGTAESHNNVLALDALTVTASDSVINANLDLSGATVTLGGHSVKLGCDLKFDGTTITLSAADIEQINTEAGLLLFTSVDSLTLGSSTYNKEDYHNYAGAAGLTLSTTATLPETVYLNYSAADRTVTLSVVPEPATATLSLLALAALAARRRRK